MRYSDKALASIFALGLGAIGFLCLGVGTGITLIWNLLAVGIPFAIVGSIFLLVRIPFARFLKQP